MSKQVVVGGLGNLGRHLQRILLEHGHTVSVVDRASETSPVHDSVQVTPFALGQEDPQQLVECLKGAQTVYSVVTPDVEHGTVGDFIQTNQVGVQQLVDACKEAGVPKLVYASSIAVTNHLRDSVNENEQVPLPSMDSYQSFYDKTKRQGEDTVLQASSDHLKTCALRMGGILAGPSDYSLRKGFALGEKSGVVNTAAGKPIDMIAAQDAAMALYKASEKLEDSASSSLPGSALFVSKCKTGQAPKTHELGTLQAELMGWKVQMAPPIILKALGTVWGIQHAIRSIYQDETSLPGMPPQIFLDLVNYEQTFDNSLAYKTLDFKPELSWEQALESAVEEYRNSNK